MSLLSKVCAQFAHKHGTLPPVVVATPLVCLILGARGEDLSLPADIKLFSSDIRDSDVSPNSPRGVVLFARGQEIVAADLSELGSARLDLSSS